MTPPEVTLLRQRGMRILVAASWAVTLFIVIATAIYAEGKALPVLVMGAAANILPTWMVERGRTDSAARITVSTLAAILPALGVYALSGHSWQMDAHMYFFVALAALTILCDWRAIIVASALIALHHLVLQFIMPAWVFYDGSGLGRVVFHAAAVVMQAAMLIYLIHMLRSLMQRQADARLESERVAEVAEARRGAAEDAMTAAAEASRREAEDRKRQAEAERAAAARQQMQKLTLDFQANVAGVVRAVGDAAAELDNLGHALLDMARRGSRESTDTASRATQASASADVLAARLHDMAASITAIAASADQQARRSDDASSISAAGRDAVRILTEQSHSITGFADSIHNIAAHTNLLALNATIEAAHAGDVGRGFAVVAHEVKALAGQAATATEEIRQLAGSVDSGADIAQDALTQISEMVADLATAANAIRSAVEMQRETAAAIELSARDTALGVEAMAGRVVEIASIASETETLSDRVAGAARSLSATARRLDDATRQFVTGISAA